MPNQVDTSRIAVRRTGQGKAHDALSKDPSHHVCVTVLASEPRQTQIREELALPNIQIAPARSVEPVDVVIIHGSARNTVGPLASLKLRNRNVAVVRLGLQQTPISATEVTIAEPVEPARLVAILILAAANIRAVRSDRQQSNLRSGLNRPRYEIRNVGGVGFIPA